MKRIISGLVFLTCAAFSSDWMQWRGPELNGTCDAGNLPTAWSLERGENIAWSCELPGTGQSTPIVVGNRIFISAHAENDELHAICIDRTSGKIEWDAVAGSGAKAQRGNTMASPSAVSDGKTVWFLFGQGTVSAFSLDGAKRWQRELQADHGKLDSKFGFSSSPLLHEGALYLPLLYLPQNEQKVSNAGQRVMALEAETGKTLWSVERPTEAIQETLDSYITPVPTEKGIVVTGADYITCHAFSDRKEVWRTPFNNEKNSKIWRIISSPVQAGNLTITAYPRGRTLIALKSGGGIRWDYEGRVPDVCTPAYEDGLLYVLDGVKRYLTCLDAKTGREIWQDKIDSAKGFFASPLVADGKIYLINHNAEVFIYAAAKKPELLNRVPMAGKNSYASIVAADESLYIRLPDKLFCVRKQ